MRVKTGDAVIEKVSGQRMTVTGLCEEESFDVQCRWWDMEGGAYRERRFLLSDLKPAK